MHGDRHPNTGCYLHQIRIVEMATSEKPKGAQGTDYWSNFQMSKGLGPVWRGIARYFASQ